MEEVKAYMEDYIFGTNLIEISQALLELESNDADEVMGWPDNLKLKSSMTLFVLAKPGCEVFQKMLDKFFHGERDQKTIEIVLQANGAELNMLDTKNMDYKPTIAELESYISNPMFEGLLEHMQTEYKALRKVEYSKDVWLRGWNIKLRKAGKSLCVIYPRQGYFTVLIVVSEKEKERIENLLPQLTNELQEIYHSTKEGNGQRWLMIDVKDNVSLYHDILKLIRIRRETR